MSLACLKLTSALSWHDYISTDNTENTMLDENDIERSEITLGTANAILHQAELRMSETLNISNSIDVKATIMFAGFIAIGVFLCGFIINSHGDLSAIMLILLLAVIIPIVLGAFRFFSVFNLTDYDVLGKDVRDWIVPEIIDDKKDKEIAIIICHTARQYVKTIDNNHNRNEKKVKAFNSGIRCLMFAGALALIAALIAIGVALCTNFPCLMTLL